MPGDDGATVAPYRYGCYVNEFGVANYRFTAPDALVYVGILGTGKDLARAPRLGVAWQPGCPGLADSLAGRVPDRRSTSIPRPAT